MRATCSPASLEGLLSDLQHQPEALLDRLAMRAAISGVVCR
jgi:hypothetical protein